MLRSRNKTGL